jgi:AAA15 family ATPase/GTPase
MKNKIDKEFYLTRGQYADKLGKSKGSVIQLMRRGKLNNEYIIRDGWYFFRDPSKKRAYKETVHGPIYTPKKTYNRGNHDNANYPNHAFQQHNEMKRLAAIQHKVPKDIQNRLPRAIEMLREEDRKNQQQILQKSTTKKNYGGFLTADEMRRYAFQPTNRSIKTDNKKYYW